MKYFEYFFFLLIFKGHNSKIVNADQIYNLTLSCLISNHTTQECYMSNVIQEII